MKIRSACLAAFVAIALLFVPASAFAQSSPGVLCTTTGAFPIYDGTRWLCSTATAPQAAILNGTMNLNPLAASSQRGLNITTSGPGSGSTAGAIYNNLVQGSWNNTLTGAGSPGTPTCPCWSLFQISASTGASFDGVESYGLAVGNVMAGANTTSSDIVGISGGVYTNYATPNARFYGGAFAATTGPNGTTPFLLGLEIAASNGNATPGAVENRAAINLISYETHQASTFDAAIAISGGNPGGQFEHVIGLFTKAGTLADALSTTGDIIYAQTAQTVGSIINVPLLDVTNYVINTKNAKLTGAGILDLGTTAVDGGLVLSGGSGANLQFVSQYNGTPLWVQGAVSSTWYISAVGFGSNAIQIAHSTNQVTMPNGLAVQTSFSSTANLSINKTLPQIFINKAASGDDALLVGRTNGSNRWLFNLANSVAESGSNVGSDFSISRFSDAGSFLATPFGINRATGAISLGEATTSAIVAALSTAAATSSTTGGLRSAGGIGAAGAIWAGTYVASGVVAVASLPTCNSGIQGARMVVNNATATTFASTVAGGGANIVPVLCNGTNWIIGSAPANDNDPLSIRKYA
jgi:hypothetical protein